MSKNVQLWAGILLYQLCTMAMAQKPTLEWAQRFNTLGKTDEHAFSVAVDEGGNSYVTGTSTKPGSFSQITTIKYAPSGEQLWVTQFQDSSTAVGIAVDNTGGVYVIGESNSDYLTIRYDAASAEQVWAQYYDGPANNHDKVYDIALD